MDKVNKQELRRLAVEAMPGNWHVEDGMGMVYDEQMDFVCDTGEDEPCKSAFIAAANPAAILSLLDELDASSCRAWQEKCLKHGFKYVREPDDHYVVADPAEMVSLLRDLLGVDVRQKDSSDYGQSVAELQEQIEGLVNTIHELEQYRKDALYKKAVEKITVDDAGGMGKTIRWIIDQYVDQLAKEGGANG